MPLSLAEIANDPDIGESVMIIRERGQFALGVGWQTIATAKIPTHGVVAIADAEALRQVAEGDRIVGSLQLICAQAIYETLADQSGVSDKIRWNGNLYRVQSVEPWFENGFWSAILVRMKGN